MPNSNLAHTAAIMLAAGRGSRMKAKFKNKVAFSLHGKPMIRYTSDNLLEAGVSQRIAVVGFAAETVKLALGKDVTYATQVKLLGTGDAIKCALAYLNPDISTILSVYGDDSAFYPPELYQEMVNRLESKKLDLLFLTIHKEDPTGLGRIIRDSAGDVLRIVEEKNATKEEREITEINTGFYCFRRSFLEKHINEITINALTGEFYITDMVEIALKNHGSLEAYCAPDNSIWHGVNNRSDFARAQKKFSR